ncbi:hypothetical protein, partial [Priestia filamentosa]|uniref:hypothetical protein n=1 Tax=Priestia filamentosa TaxID=1402861 RepID=UPI0039827A22
HTPPKITITVFYQKLNYKSPFISSVFLVNMKHAPDRKSENLFNKNDLALFPIMNKHNLHIH